MERDAATGLYRTAAIEVPFLEGRGTQDTQALVIELVTKHGVIIEELDDLSKSGHVQLRLHSRDTDALTKAVDDLNSRVAD